MWCIVGNMCLNCWWKVSCSSSATSLPEVLLLVCRKCGNKKRKCWTDGAQETICIKFVLFCSKIEFFFFGSFWVKDYFHHAWRCCFTLIWKHISRMLKSLLWKVKQKTFYLLCNGWRPELVRCVFLPEIQADINIKTVMFGSVDLLFWQINRFITLDQYVLRWIYLIASSILLMCTLLWI